MSTRPEDTAGEWQRLLHLCANSVPVCHGALDSFLSGPDLDRRVELVLAEVRINETLRLGLRDTLTMPQTQWSAGQLARLLAATHSTKP